MEIVRPLTAPNGYGLVQMFVGHGKGKTTAAIGEVVRAIGAGRRAGIIFFDKGGTHYSERAALLRLGVRVEAVGRDRIDPNTGRFDFSVTEVDRTETARGLSIAREWMNELDVLVLDEINSCVALEMIGREEVLGFLDKKPLTLEVILTGRNVPVELLDRAHLITEMVKRRHYYERGVKARDGLDF